MRRLALLAFVLAVSGIAPAAAAQGPPDNGPRTVDPGWFALTNARVVTAPGQSLEGTVVVRDSVVTAVGATPPPAGATVIDCTGLTIYPGLIEPCLPTDVPSLDPVVTDQHWNPMIQPQRDALDGDLVPAADRTALRALGFTAAAVAPSGGILKGSAAVIQLDEPEGGTKARVVRRTAYAVASLQTNRGGYPNSEMGAVALLRQSLADGLWYERCQKTLAADPSLLPRMPQPSAALQAIADQRALPLWFDTRDELQALRADAIGREFEREVVLVGSGMEFRRLTALRHAGRALVVPLELPESPDVGTAAAAHDVSLRQLQSWEHAPTNSKRLLDAGLTIAWTTARGDKKDFPARVRDARLHGVSEQQALAALTTVPAKLLGVDAVLGTIAVGKLANLVVVRGALFDEGSQVLDVFVGGKRHRVAEPKDARLDGTFDVAAGWPTAGASPRLVVDGDKVTLKRGDDAYEVADVERKGTLLHCRVRGADLPDGADFWLRLHAAEGGLAGVLTAVDGADRTLRATRAEPTAANDEPKAPPKPRADAAVPLPSPLGGYGFVEPPAAEAFAIVGATIWTCDGRGALRDGAVVVDRGKIVFAGPRGDMPALPSNARVVDAKGKHVTPGVIDCHSHTGISRGVNESGQAVTAEVRIRDVVDPDDVNWYRQLAGGVTAVNQLHGSANAIGGQSNTVKVRWGAAHPTEFDFAGAAEGIKFALGENPRGANGRDGGGRYPNTRMGVEALIRDRFAAAQHYAREHAAYRALDAKARAKVLPPRTDFELEALSEVLAGTRRIHCHSYRQDEIFMLCGLAQEYGIRIGTFQHVLEGYKVADAIRQSAIGASSFSDWWAYKFEVYDAIPDNGAILHEVGVNVSFNSDSNEHARRLNTEAGKAIKYGGVSPTDALCFVTRNPAIQLGIFDRTGSLTAGKDADLALWSADPLRYAAVCEATWVDGRLLFSLERDQQNRALIAAERTRLIGKALAAGKGKKGSGRSPRDAYWAAEDLTDAYCCSTCEGARR